MTLAEARDQCEIAATDTNHDTKLTRYIKAAREQVEDDSEYKLITQTFTLSMTDFPGEPFIYLPVRPIQSISSITYYDGAGDSQTLSTDVYGLDAARRVAYLKYNQTWPAYREIHDGIVVTMVCGFGAASAVPELLKQMILLQTAKWFEHRGDESKMPAHDSAYESLLKRVMRSTYP